MQAQEISKKAIWEDFLSQCEEKTFLDSWNWGEFQKKMGEKIWRLGIYENGDLLAVALVVRVRARRGTFLFVPHLVGIKNKELRIKVLEVLTEYLKDLAKKEGAVFLRVAPLWERTGENTGIFRSFGFRNAPTHMHPEVTWELDIISSEEELLAGMRKTTRYLIRQAQKNSDIEIVQGKSLKDIEDFYNLHQETVDRHHFVPFSLEYMRKEFESFAPRPPDAEPSGDAGGADNEIVVFHGKYQSELAASAIIIFWQGSAYYHHGATSLKYPKIPVAQLLQWEIIREAKRRRCARYNFWGIAPTDNKRHPWAGLTLFKTGFGGYKKEYVKTQDLPLSWRYWPVSFFERVRRMKRGL